MGKFVIREVKTGIKFDLKAGNGEVIATSEVYNSMESCKNGVASVQKNAPVAAVENQTVEGYAVEKHPKFEVYKDKAGEFRFRLKATNGQIIAVGEGYKALAGCMNGIESVKKNAAYRLWWWKKASKPEAQAGIPGIREMIKSKNASGKTAGAAGQPE